MTERDPTDVREQERLAEDEQSRAKRLALRQKEDFQKLMATPEGRRFVWELLEFAGIYRDSYTGNSGTFYNEGRRSVGLMVMKKLEEYSPETFVQMLTERIQ